MKVYLIGTGTGGTRTLTHEAADAISGADVLIGALRMLEPYANSGKQMFRCWHPEQIADILRKSPCETAAVLYSGDCGFFSGAASVLPYLRDFDTVIMPGISSMAAFCARCRIGYENMKCISLHGKKANIALPVHLHEHCFFLLGGTVSAAALCRHLCEYGLADVRVTIGKNLGLPDERILSGKTADFLDLASETLTVLITENRNYQRFLPSAIPDSAFERAKVPMTKSEVRCCSVAAMEISFDAVCWDIGCGTGSVSVEAAFRCPEGIVYAFDHNAEAVRLTEANARHFHCDNIRVIEGECPAVLQDAPAPDAVFIGGSAGNLSGILDMVYQKNSAAVITMTAVSLETLTQAAECLRAYSGAFAFTQIAVTRSKKIGNYTMPDPLNPVWLITGRLQCEDS